MHLRARNFSNVQVSGLPSACKLVHEVLTSALITSISSKSFALKSLSQWYKERYWSAFSHVCQFDAKSTSVQVFVDNASRPTSLANKKTLINISEPAICHEYWSEDSLVQHLSLKQFNVNVHYNNDTLAQLNDCTEALLHLGLKLSHLRLYYIQDRYYIQAFNSRLPVSQIYNFVQKVQVMQQMTLAQVQVK